MKQNDSYDIFYQLLNEQKSLLLAARKRNGGTSSAPPKTAAPAETSEWSVWHNVEIEVHELFGAFPAKNDCAAKYIMLAHELCRVHTRMMDYRNAYKVIM